MGISCKTLAQPRNGDTHIGSVTLKISLVNQYKHHYSFIDKHLELTSAIILLVSPKNRKFNAIKNNKRQTVYNMYMYGENSFFQGREKG